MNVLKLPICMLLIDFPLLVDTFLLSLLVPEKQIMYSFCNTCIQGPPKYHIKILQSHGTSENRVNPSFIKDFHGWCYFLCVHLHALMFWLFWFDLKKWEMQFTSKIKHTEHEDQQWRNGLSCRLKSLYGCFDSIVNTVNPTQLPLPSSKTELPIKLSEPPFKPGNLSI